MILCPIAKWKKLEPKKPAFDSLSYEELDLLIQKLSQPLSSIDSPLIAFTPKTRAIDIALFFAAWRLGKAVYPLSFRLPQKAIEERLLQTGAVFVDIDHLKLEAPLELNLLNEESIATLIESSGSTKAPKIVCHLLRSHLASALSTSLALEITSESYYALNLPLFHISGLALCLRTFLTGGALTSAPQKATHLSMVPTQLYRLIESGETLPKIKCLLIGGAPLSPLLYQKGVALGLPLFTSYGMTETGSMIVLNGTPLSHVAIKLSPEGEIFIKGNSLFENYFGDRARNQEEWFATRDLGKINKKGELEITGRKDRQFISGGENIQPEEIESVLLQIKGVLQARVDPIAHPEFGMAPSAVLYCTESLSIEKIREYLEEVLPRFKIPKEIVFSVSKLVEKSQYLVRDRN